MEFATIIKVLQLAAAAASAAAQARELALAIRNAYQQSNELTAEQSAELDALAAQVFSSPESQPSGR